MCDVKPALELLGEVCFVIIRIIKLIFVFDVHGAGVTNFRQHAKEALPVYGTVTGHAEPPPTAVVDGLNPGAPNNVPQNFGVLEMNVIDLVRSEERRVG